MVKGQDLMLIGSQAVRDRWYMGIQRFIKSDSTLILLCRQYEWLGYEYTPDSEFFDEFSEFLGGPGPSIYPLFLICGLDHSGTLIFFSARTGPLRARAPGKCPGFPPLTRALDLALLSFSLGILLPVILLTKYHLLSHKVQPSMTFSFFILFILLFFIEISY